MEAQGWINQYAAGMSRLYRRTAAFLTREAINRTAASHAALMRRLDAPFRFAWPGVKGPDPEVAWRLRLALEKSGRQALDELRSRREELQAAWERYCRLLAALSRPVDDTAEKELWPERTAAIMENIKAGIRERLQLAAADLFAKRYEPAAFRLLLVDLVWQDQPAAEAAEAAVAEIYKEKKNRWEKLAAALGLKLAGEPEVPEIAPSPLAAAFLAPIQWQYERPGVWRGVWEALQRDRFLAKLEDEVEAGMFAYSEEARKLCREAAAAIDRGYYLLGQAAAAALLHKESGIPAEQCEAEIKRLSGQEEVLVAWLAALSTMEPQELWRSGKKEMSLRILQLCLAAGGPAARTS